MATKRKKIIQPGIYDAQVKKVTAHPNGMVTVQLQLTGKGFTFTERHTLKPSSEPEEGIQKFFVLCSRLSIYTTIGADNRHHAAHKATKLFGPHWSSLTQSHYLVKDNVFEPVISFGQLVRSLQI